MTRHRLTGTVVSAKMQKTILVRVVRLTQHPQYGRVIRRAKKFAAHDESQTAKPGDLVEIEETRPLSKTKRWRLIQVLRRAPEELSADSASAEQALAGEAFADTASAEKSSAGKTSADTASAEKSSQ